LRNSIALNLKLGPDNVERRGRTYSRGVIDGSC